MKHASILFLLLLVAFSLSTTVTIAQQSSAPHVAQIAPFDKAVPGQIMQLLVEGLEGGVSSFRTADDFKLTVSQDGVSQGAKIRSVTMAMKRVPQSGKDDRPGAAPGNQMRSFQSVNFIVPQGLHSGETELTLSYRGRRTNSVILTIVEKPLRPIVSNMTVLAMSPSSIPTKLEGNDLGWRLERGSTVQLFVNPTTDPDDPTSAVMVRFKQGDNYYDERVRMISQPFGVENVGRDVGFFPARDILEVDVPAGLTMGPAEVEIRLRANGQEGEAATLKATITDSARSAEAPAANAPRLLMVSPARVSAGQSLMLTVDYQRTLDPDPAKTLMVIEQGSARYLITPEQSSAIFERTKEPNLPVVFFVRTTKQIIGKAQIRVFNQLRGEQTGMSNPVAIEILDETLPPELIGVNESTEAELTPLRQMYEMQARAGRKFSEFDPQRKYVTIRVKGTDYNPHYVRITFEQGGRRFSLRPEDFSITGGELLIVRLPKEIRNGPVKLSIENRGIDSYSIPVSKSFEICCTP